MMTQPPPASLQTAAAVAVATQHHQQDIAPRSDSVNLQQNLNISTNSTIVHALQPSLVTTASMPSVPTSLLSPNGLIPFPLAAANPIQPTVMVATTDQIPTTPTPYHTNMLATQFQQNPIFAAPSTNQFVPIMDESKLKELVRGQM
jgi:hypothetical protein